MIDIDVILKILPLFLLCLISPGPDFMMVSSLSLSRGRIEGMKAAAGIALVNGAYTVISLTGLAILFSKFFWLIVGIKICGGFYLSYLGYKMWRASFAPPAQVEDKTVAPKQKNSFLTGMFCCLTNPKAIAFFASIFALALTPDTSLATKITVATGIPAVVFAWFSFVAFGLSKPFIRNHYDRWQKTIDRAAGTVIGLFGLKLILSARN